VPFLHKCVHAIARKTNAERSMFFRCLADVSIVRFWHLADKLVAHRNICFQQRETTMFNPCYSTSP
jgi:hypothetical protein